jgi:hypothetical protein
LQKAREHDRHPLTVSDLVPLDERQTAFGVELLP